MECNGVQTELSGGSGISPAIQRHLDGCEKCRAFAADLRTIRELCASSVTTPVALKEQTLNRSLALLAEKPATVARTPFAQWRRRFDSPPYIAAGATLSLLILATLAIVQAEGVPGKETSMSIKLTLILFVIQNIVAALFLPALLKMKHRFQGRYS